MYAIIRTGGQQFKVEEGDVIDVERLRGEGEVSFVPLLVVDDKGKVFSHREQLRDAKVVARIVGVSAGPKVDIFKYKAKTGYNRRQGHRQRYTTIEVTAIKGPEGAVRMAAEAAAKPAAASAGETAAVAKPTTAKPAVAKTAAEGTAAKKPAARKAAAAKTAAKGTAAKKPAARKAAAAKTAAKGTAAKKPAAKKPAAKKTTTTRKASASKPSSSKKTEKKEG